jgi:hypothetical protein
MLSVLRLCNEEQLRLRQGPGTAVRRVASWCEMSARLEVNCETFAVQYGREHVS